MSCNSSTYSSTCCPEVPYPSISSESVPSLIDNLVYALYGTINKSVSSGRVVWDIPCDPSTTPAEVPSIPRQTGEGLLCYIIRVFQSSVAVIPNVVQTNTNNTFTGNNTFNQSILASGGVTGNLTGNVTGNVTGNLTGNVTGNVVGSAATLTTPRTISIIGDIIGTATSFNGSANISIPTNLNSGVTINSPILGGTATGSLISKVILGVTDGSNAAVGHLGQVVSSTIAVGSAVALTSGVVANVTSISLPAGDWYVNGQVDYRAGATTSITILTQGISQASATLGSQDTFSRIVCAAVVPTASNDIGLAVRGQRISLATTTTIFLVASATFTISTLSAYGTIEARRVR